jgi:hypothetical protein
LLAVSALTVGLWDWIRLVRAVVREKGNLGMFQFHHNPHPKKVYIQAKPIKRKPE